MPRNYQGRPQPSPILAQHLQHSRHQQDVNGNDLHAAMINGVLPGFTEAHSLNLGNIWNTYGLYMDYWWLAYFKQPHVISCDIQLWSAMAMAWVTMSKLLDSPVWSFFAPLVFQWFPVPTVLLYHRLQRFGSLKIHRGSQTWPQTCAASGQERQMPLAATSADPSCQLPKGEVRPPKVSQLNTHWSSTLHVCCISMHFVAQWSHLRPSRP